MPTLVSLVCSGCGKSFDRRKNQIRPDTVKNYCSDKCRITNTRWIILNCLRCGKEFPVIPSRTKNNRAKYCSKECTRNRVNRICETCGKQFPIQIYQLNNGEGRYCSRKCRFTGVSRKCATCGTEFYVPKHRVNDPIRGKYCSKKCRFFQIEYECEACGKRFMRGRTETGRFCSIKCYWSTSTQPVRKQIREMYKYRKWRELVFKRDNYTCVRCGDRGVYLHAHHKIGFEVLIKRHDIKSRDDARDCSFLWDIDNGETLCVYCHTLTENYGTKKTT